VADDIQNRVGKEQSRYNRSFLLEDRDITKGFVTRKPTVLGTSLDDDDDADDHDNDHNDDDSDDVRCVYFIHSFK
jgi:hypothetical protein